MQDNSIKSVVTDILVRTGQDKNGKPWKALVLRYSNGYESMTFPDGADMYMAEGLLATQGQGSKPSTNITPPARS